MEIVGEYSDEGYSGKNIKGRQEFMRMLNDIEDGKDGVDFVLVFKLSRLGRNAADVLSSLQLMQDYGVNLICVEDGIDSSKEADKLLISIIAAVAEMERENIRVQTMAGREQKAREGKWNGGFAPYGYRMENGEFVIAEEDWELVQEKRSKNNYRREKIHDLEHAHILSGILKCLCCGKGMYGNIAKAGRKDNKTRYLEKQLSVLNASLHQAETIKTRIEQQLDNLDVTDTHYDKKISDLQRRLDAQYDRIDEVEETMIEPKSQIYELKKNQIDADSIYGFLGAFNEVYSEY